MCVCVLGLPLPSDSLFSLGFFFYFFVIFWKGACIWHLALDKNREYPLRISHFQSDRERHRRRRRRTLKEEEKEGEMTSMHQ